MATTKQAAERSMAAVKAAAAAGKSRLIVYVLEHKGTALPGFSADRVKASRRAAYYRAKRGMDCEILESRITITGRTAAAMYALTA